MTIQTSGLQTINSYKEVKQRCYKENTETFISKVK